MKKTFTATIIIAAIIMICFISSSIYTNIKLNKIEELVLTHHQEIINIESINTVGKWGESFSEYVLVVEMNNNQYRIWVNNQGNVTAQELLYTNLSE